MTVDWVETYDDSYENTEHTDHENSRRSILTYESQSGISRLDLQDESAAKKLDKALDLLAQIAEKTDSKTCKKTFFVKKKATDVKKMRSI